MVGGAVPCAPLNGGQGTGRPTIKLRGLKVGANAAEHKSVALAKHLLPLGVYKNGGAQGLRPLPISTILQLYTAKSVKIRDIRG